MKKTILTLLLIFGILGYAEAHNNSAERAGSSGAIIGVVAGTNLNGGGAFGIVTLNLDDPFTVGGANITVLQSSTITAIGAGGLAILDDGNTIGIFLEDGGQVGIATYNPAFALDVNGTSRFAGAFQTDGLTTIGDSPLDLFVFNPSTFVISDVAWGMVISTSIDGNPPLMFFDTPNSRIGIGDLTPSDKLEVQKNINNVKGITIVNDMVGTSAGASLTIKSNSATGNLTVYDDGYTTESHFADRVVLLTAVNSDGLDLVSKGSDIRFYTSGSATSDEKMRILDGGNVGIGTTTPSALFTVGNNDQFTVDSSGNVVVVGTVTATVVETTTVTAENSDGLYLLDDDGRGIYLKDGGEVYYLGAGKTYFSGTVNLSATSKLRWIAGSANYGGIEAVGDDGLHIDGGVSAYGNRNVIITDYANRATDHDHDLLSAHPTLFIHSVTDPDTVNTEWGSLSYIGDGTGDGYFEINTTTGDIVLNPDLGYVGISSSAPTEMLSVVGNGIFTGNLEVRGNLNLPNAVHMEASLAGAGTSQNESNEFIPSSATWTLNQGSNFFSVNVDSITYTHADTHLVVIMAQMSLEASAATNAELRFAINNVTQISSKAEHTFSGSSLITDIGIQGMYEIDQGDIITVQGKTDDGDNLTYDDLNIIIVEVD